MASGPITSWQIDRETVETVADFIFWGSKITAAGDWSSDVCSSDLDLLAVQGTLKSLLQHHSSKPLILWHSAFFIVQLSHPYMTTGKTV